MGVDLSEREAADARWRPSPEAIMYGVIVTLMVVRVAVLSRSFLNLGGDEAQYWAWSRHLAFGYFSKPPMIAWLIAATTSVCGNSEPCVRVSSPLLHAGTAIAIFYVARRLYDARVGLWSAIAFATLPVVWLSSALITTDVPLVFFWALALLGLDKMIAAKAGGQTGAALRLGALTGAAIGLGLMAKYAMVYFLICMAVHCIVSPEARRAILSPAGALLGAGALLLFAPNLIWNGQSGFATFQHTAADANWGAHLFNPDKLGDFLTSQVGVFGPIMTIMFLFGLVTLKRRLDGPYAKSDKMMLSYALPIIVIILVQSFISRANANWTAPAYVSATIVTVAWLLRASDKVRPRKFLKVSGQGLLTASIAMHLVTGTVLYAAGTVPGAIELLGLDNSFKRVRGWNGLADKLDEAVQGAPYKALVTDDRMIMAEIIYYGRKTHIPVVIFDINGVPANEFELNSPYRPSIGDPVLLVTAQPRSRVVAHFELAEPVETFRMKQGGKYFTDFHLIRLADFRGRRTADKPPPSILKSAQHNG